MRKKSAQWLDLLFENRNKSYGAYDLRIHYEDRLLKSFCIALLIAALMFLIPVVLTKILTQQQFVKKHIHEIPISPQTFIIEKSKPEANINPPAARHHAIHDSYRIVKNMEEEVKKVDETKTDNIDINSTNTGENTADNNSGTSTSSQILLTFDPAPIEPMSFASVDVAPQFPGGEDALLKYLSDHIRYSDAARNIGITGKVYVSFIVNEEGKIENTLLKGSLFDDLDNEVIRVVKNMPQWTAGIYKGKKVKTIFYLPVSFRLK